MIEKLKERNFKIQILKWTCIGLALRLILMPFTMHGRDLLFIHYFPMMLVKEGIWDTYSFMASQFSSYPLGQGAVPYTYYGPVIFVVMSAANFIFIKLLSAISLVKLLEVGSTMMFVKGMETIHYVNAFSQLELFKNLFLMKIPYLVFDFLIGGALLALAPSRKSALISYALWMLNIVVLHSVYAIGQVDLIPAFFVIAALWAAVKKRAYLSVILLTLGGATKLFPYILVLPTCLLLGRNWKDRSMLIFTSVAFLILTYLPFYLSSGTAFSGSFLMLSSVSYQGSIKWILAGVFAVFYLLLSMSAIKDSQAEKPEKSLLYYFIVIAFLSYATIPTRFRFFVYITPLLALIIPRHKWFGGFTLLIISVLAFSWLTDRDLQFGLFAPLNPVYFSNIPTIQEIIARVVNIEIIYKIMARVSILTFFIGAWWVWSIKLGNRQGPINGLRRSDN
ncbi:MAG: DUF2029 domain-containing protein [Candidatus Omnitrophica bacterium]|nr:DUF2029 domain-containing protein [Candidatus Omnitrophota bacterium]